MIRFTTKRRSRLGPRRAMTSSDLGPGNARKVETEKNKGKAVLDECTSPGHSEARTVTDAEAYATLPVEAFKVPAERSTKVQPPDPTYLQLFNPPFFVKASSPIAALRVIQWDDERQMFVKTEGNNESLHKDLAYTFGPLHDLSLRKMRVEVPEEDYQDARFDFDIGEEEPDRDQKEEDESQEDSQEARNKLEAQEALLMLAEAKDLGNIFHVSEQEANSSDSGSTGRKSSRSRCSYSPS